MYNISTSDEAFEWFRIKCASGSSPIWLSMHVSWDPES